MERIKRWMPLAAILMLAFNLRPVAVSVGPVLGDIAADLGMSGATAGFLTSLPALCFAVFGAVAPALSARVGQHRTVGLALLALVAGQVGRVFTDRPWVFLALSMLALAGMAMGNVLLPSLVRRHFPNRVGLATSLYSVFLAIGVTSASIATVPLAVALGGWRAAFTAGATIALAALLCWLPMLRHNQPVRRGDAGQAHVGLAAVARTPIGWALAVYFGMQSAHAYSLFGWLPTVFIDAGMTQVRAGLMLGVVTGLGILTAFVVPVWVGRVREPIGLILGINAMLSAAFLGLILAPMAAPLLWAVLFALGLSGFPFFLALVATRARTPSGTAALSGFAQSVGYLISAAGPLAMGILRDVFTSWTIPLLLQLSLVVPMTILGVHLSRSWFVEDRIARPVAS